MSDNTTDSAMSVATASDPRTKSTRESLFTAFARLMQNNAYDEIRASDIAAQAQVARSTLYEHFRSKEELMLESIESQLSVLAGSAAGLCSPRQLRLMLLHLWDRRTFIRTLLTGVTLERISRRLVEMIYVQLCETQQDCVDLKFLRLRAIRSAGGQVSLVRAWLSGEVPNDIKPIVRLILDSSLGDR